MMPEQSRRRVRFAALAPHPLLKSYYADEPGRKRRVNEMFDVSAPHYDWITGAMSFGTGRWYRRDVLRRYGVAAGTRLLDVGSGTGVIAALAQELVGPDGQGRRRRSQRGHARGGEARPASATPASGAAKQLPVGDAEFDILTMGYALRHVEDLTVTFREYLARAQCPAAGCCCWRSRGPKGASITRA